MVSYLVGIDHRALPFKEREILHRQQKDITAFWAGHVSQLALVLVTCNRLEVYAVAKDLSEAERHIHLFSDTFPAFDRRSYAVFGESDVFLHVLRLACGLSSQLKGELQILEQLQSWNAQQVVSPLTGRLVSQAVAWAVDIRHRAGLCRPERNAATLIFDDVSRQFGREDEISVLMIGTGKFIELFTDLHLPQVRFYFAAHKNSEKAERLAEKTKGVAVPLKGINSFLPEMDVVISATTSPHFILKVEDFSGVPAREGRPLYLYDMSFPRDIDPLVGSFTGVVLKTPETLGGVFNEWNAHIQGNIEQAEYLCAEIAHIYPQQERYGKDRAYGRQAQFAGA